MLKILMNSGPWGPWGGAGNNQKPNDSKPNNSESPKSEKKSPPPKNPKNDFEDFFKKIFDRIKNFLDSAQSGKSPKSLVGIIILVISLLWLSLGFYQVDTDENAVLLYFGKFYKVTTPGLNYHIPYPFGQVIKKSVTAVNTEEFGFSSSKKKNEDRDFNAESLMLTGDENIVDIEFQVQWQISDIKDFTFSIADPNQTIRKSSESAMREIIARTPIVSALSDGKGKIENETKDLLQAILDSYGAGVRVVLVQLRRVDPPAQVIDAFRDVQTAKADKEKEINEGQAYANDIIPRARGEAAQKKEQAEAYAKEVVTNAQGEAGRFNSVYNQYSKAKKVTRKRLYLETMEKIYQDTDKVFIDKSVAKSGVTPYFPLNEIKQQPKKE
ncbi:MAG: FtsH protease activity modulator HflK [Proteobacteria bacterium]|nr:FtsH protease activity modulator HflK [Pseudomonadota bacterium]